MWFKHRDAPGRKRPWKQDSPGRGGGKKPATFFFHLLATEGLISALPPDKHWGHPGLSKVLPHKELTAPLPALGICTSQGPVHRVQSCALMGNQEKWSLSSQKHWTSRERVDEPAQVPGSAQEFDRGTSGLSIFSPKGAAVKHRQVGAACNRDGFPLGRGLPLGGGLPLGPGKAGPETRFRERAVGPVPTEARPCHQAARMSMSLPPQHSRKNKPA